MMRQRAAVSVEQAIVSRAEMAAAAIAVLSWVAVVVQMGRW